MNKVTFAGYYGKNNCGDDAFTYALPLLMPSGSDCVFTDGVPPNDGSTLILGAGNVLMPYFLNKLPKDRPMYVLGGALAFDADLEHLLKYNLKECVVRTRADAELLQSAGLKARYAPDVAFALDVPTGPSRLERPANKKLLGVMVADTLNLSPQRPHKEIMYGEYFRMELASILEELSQWYKVVFIPMSHKMRDFDLRSIYDVASFMSEKIEVDIMPVMNPLEVLKVVSELDLLITARFHGLVFSTLAGVPFINIGMTKKSLLFCSEAGLDILSVDPYSLSQQRFMAHVKAAESPGISERLQALTSINKVKLEDLKNHIAQNWF